MYKMLAVLCKLESTGRVQTSATLFRRVVLLILTLQSTAVLNKLVININIVQSNYILNRSCSDGQ